MLDALHKTIPYPPTSKDLSSIANDKFAVWSNLLSYLKTEVNFVGHYPFWENDLQDGSLFKGISDNCDYDNGSILYLDIENIYNESTTTSTTIWNESLNDLIKTWLDFSKVIDEDTEIVPNGRITFSDIFKADAGYSFESEPFVKAWKNIDNETYAEVRTTKDMVMSVIKSDRNLQFTRSISSAARPLIRLIMPKYTRRVEIEDLNRDFWVIGQTITGISQYLFDDNGAMPKIFKGIISELLQLWENILYLWAELGLLAKKQYPIKILYEPLPNSVYQPYAKFDNFEAAASLSIASIEQRCQYLVDKYPNNNLVVLPFIRNNNYRHNYYSKQIFPCILFYNRYKNGWIGREIKCNNQPLTISITGSECGVSWGNKIYGIKEIEDNKFKYCAPCQEADYDINMEEGKYYGLIRVIPSINGVHYDNNDNIIISSLRLSIYDAAAPVINNSTSLIGNIQTTSSISSGESTPVALSAAAQGSDKTLISPTTLTAAKGEAYYQGELVSGYAKAIVPIIKNADFKVVKIGDFYPIDLAQSGEGFEPITAQSGSSSNRYCWDTYGIGGFYNTRKYDTTTQTGYYTTDTKLVFRYYGTGDYFEAHTLTPEWLRGKGAGYIKKLIDDNSDTYKSITNEPTLFVTRIGIGYWTGEAGSQWSYGVFCDLYFSNEEGITWLGPIYLFDGYWTDNTEIFSMDDSNVRWRSLRMRCNSFTARTVNETTDYKMTGGQLAWFDYNKIVNEGDTSQTFSNRPNCNINFDNNKNTLTFSGHVNEISGETKFTIMVETHGDKKHIFKQEPDTLKASEATLDLSKSSIPSGFSTSNFAGAGDAERFYLVTS